MEILFIGPSFLGGVIKVVGNFLIRFLQGPMNEVIHVVET